MASTTVLGLSLTLTPPLLTALRIAPLLGTTASLTHAYMEWVSIRSFIVPTLTRTRWTKATVKDLFYTGEPKNVDDLQRAKDVAIPAWFITWFNTGLYSVIGFNCVSVYGAAANLYLFPQSLGESRKWYVAGLVAALAHYAFVPAVAGSVERVFRMCVKQERGDGVAEDERGQAVRNLDEWLSMHRLRWGTVDLAAWCCFGMGVVGVLSTA